MLFRNTDQANQSPLKQIGPTICLLLIGLSGFLSQTVSADSPKKLALLIGVSDYFHKRMEDLHFAENDVAVVGKTLKQMGFEVTTITGGDATKKELDQQIDRFLEATRKLENDDIVFVMFSGHGQQLMALQEKRVIVDDEIKTIKRKTESPFFCPRDAIPYDRLEHDLTGKSEEQIANELNLVSLNRVISGLDKKSNSRQNLLVVDACRNNPAKGKTANVTGSTTKELPNGLSILFAARSGQKSWESSNEKIKHGVLSYYLLKGMQGEARNRRDQITWLDLVSYVRSEVANEGWKVAGDKSRKQNPHFIISTDEIVVLGSGSDIVAPYMSDLDVRNRIEKAYTLMAEVDSKTLPKPDDSQKPYLLDRWIIHQRNKGLNYALLQERSKAMNGIFSSSKIASDSNQDHWYLSELSRLTGFDNDSKFLKIEDWKRIQEISKELDPSGPIHFQKRISADQMAQYVASNSGESGYYQVMGIDLDQINEFRRRVTRKADAPFLAAFKGEYDHLIKLIDKEKKKIYSAGALAIPLAFDGKFQLIDEVYKVLVKNRIHQSDINTLHYMAALVCLKKKDLKRANDYANQIHSEELGPYGGMLFEWPYHCIDCSTIWRDGDSPVYQLLGRLNRWDLAQKHLKKLNNTQKLTAQLHFVRGLLMDIPELQQKVKNFNQ